MSELVAVSESVARGELVIHSEWTHTAWEFYPVVDHRVLPGVIVGIADADGGWLPLTRPEAERVRDWFIEVLGR